MKMLTAFFCSILLLFSGGVAAQSVKTHVPPRCQALIPILYEEGLRLTPDIPHLGYYCALVEHESCITRKHSRCCSPTSELKSQREQGVGFFQLTRTWRADGTERFDTLTELANRHRSELRELSWLNVKQRPDLQVRAGVLLIRQNYKALFMVKDREQRNWMADAAFNGGLGGLEKERRACGLAANCDPGIWFEHVERYCLKSKSPLYGNRSACDINRHHVFTVAKERYSKYVKAFDQYALTRQRPEEEL